MILYQSSKFGCGLDWFLHSKNDWRSFECQRAWICSLEGFWMILHSIWLKMGWFKWSLHSFIGFRTFSSLEVFGVNLHQTIVFKVIWVTRSLDVLFSRFLNDIASFDSDKVVRWIIPTFIDWFVDIWMPSVLEWFFWGVWSEFASNEVIKMPKNLDEILLRLLNDIAFLSSD